MASGSSARIQRSSLILTVVALALLGSSTILAQSTPDKSAVPDSPAWVPVETAWPRPQFVGTGKDIRAPRTRPVQTEPGPPFLAPAGTQNVALGKPVTSSDPEPIIGELSLITDGDKEASDGSYVELGPLLQHVTIDLQARYTIYGIRLWHYHLEPKVYFDVIVQLSNDPDFITGVRTVFNNDMDNSAGLGVGTDMHYVDTRFGLLVDARGLDARYVRLYSNGSTANDTNHYIEVEVYGKPSAAAVEMVLLDIQYPQHSFGEWWGRWQEVAYCEAPFFKAPTSLMVPEGTRNVALGKPVSSSHPNLIIGELEMVTDGIKGPPDGRYIELEPDRSHITIDLQELHEIYAIAVWHYYCFPRVYFDVIVQISDSSDFSGRKTIYNSDLNNSTGLGFGKDKRYVETRFGKVIPVDGVRGRYVRLYSHGNSMNDLNHYIEVEVYGRPVK